MEDRIQIYPCVPRNLNSLKCSTCRGCKYLARQDLGRILLAVGTVEPRKNYGELVDFWKDRSEFNYFDELIIVGAAGWKSILTRIKFIRNTRAGISWLGKACDGSLLQLYKSCSVYISPSLSEGFNLPALEVRYYFRKPMILSDIPVHRELHNDSAFFFKNFSELKQINLSDLVESNIWHLPSNEENIKFKKFIMGS
jgi:glycosyltransferase involved in cell wall biosynthesis